MAGLLLGLVGLLALYAFFFCWVLRRRVKKSRDEERAKDLDKYGE
jgi:hypothetical protein